MLWLLVFWWLGWKNCVASENRCWVRLSSKVVSAVGVSEKIFFFKYCFHLDMFEVTKFRIVLDVCNVVCFFNTIILINKYLGNLFRFSLNDLPKCTTTMILNICKTYNFTCNLWCVMCDMRGSRFDFFVKCCLYE